MGPREGGEGRRAELARVLNTVFCLDNGRHGFMTEKTMTHLLIAMTDTRRRVILFTLLNFLVLC